MLPALDAILGHKPADSFTTALVIAEPFISPLSFTLTSGITFQNKVTPYLFFCMTFIVKLPPPGGPFSLVLICLFNGAHASSRTSACPVLSAQLITGKSRISLQRTRHMSLLQPLKCLERVRKEIMTRDPE